MRVKALSYASLILGVIGVALSIVLQLTEFAPPLLDLLPGTVALAVAVLLVRRVPDNRMAGLMSVGAMAGVYMMLVPALRDWALDGGLEELAVLLAQLGNLAWVVLFASFFVYLPLWFPTGDAIGARWEWVGRVSLVALAIGVIGGAFAAETCVIVPDNYNCLLELPTPWGADWITEETFVPVIALGMLMTIPAGWSLVLRFRRAVGVERLQLRWLVATSVVLIMLWLVQLVAGVAGLDSSTVSALASAMFALSATAVIASIGLAMLKYHLYEIDRIISRTVTYTVVVGLIAGAVAVVALVAGVQFREPWVVAATTLGVAAVFNPLRRRVQHWVDRRFNRSRYDAEQLIDDFAESLRDEVEPDDLIRGWVSLVSETMQPSTVRVWVRR